MNSLFRYASQITPFSRECCFTPLWRTIKNSGQAGSGREDRLEKIIKERKRNNLKMPCFCGVFNCSNRADREKDKSNYRFPYNFKSNGKEGSKLSKVRGEK